MTQTDNQLAETSKHPLVSWLESKKDRIEEYCAHGITAEQLCRTFSTALIRDTRGDIPRCTRGSIILAVSSAARLGIDPTGERNGGHFIPYKNNKRNVVELKLVLGYGALIDLIIRNSDYIDIQTELVYQGEHFKVFAGTENRIEHIPDYTIRAACDYRAVVASYSVGTHKLGHKKFQVLDRKKLDKIMAASKANDSVWKFDWEEMARKSPVRNMSKWMSIEPEFNEAIRVSDEADGFDRERQNCRARDDGAGAPVAMNRDDAEGAEPEIVDAEFTVNPDPETETEPQADPEPELDEDTGEPVPPPSDDGEAFADDLLGGMNDNKEGRKL
ncbi:MAG: recombinase RecT [Phycisphaerales bacterium]